MQDENRGIRKIDYFTVSTLILAGGTVFNIIYYSASVILFFLTAILIYIIYKKQNILNINKNSLFFLFLILFFGFATVITNDDISETYYIGMSLQVVSAFLLTESLKYNKFKKYYINVMTFICLYSITFTLILNLRRDLIELLSLVYIKDAILASWRSLYYFYNVWDIYAQFDMIRNSACFREPGMFGVYILIALLLQIEEVLQYASNNRIEYRKLMLLFFGGLSTLSTVTILGLTISSLIFILEKGKLTRRILSTMSLIAVMSTGLIFNYSGILFDKFFETNSAYVSMYDRIVGLNSTINCFLDSPVFGVGYTKYFQNVIEGVNTFSFLYVLGEFGLLMFTILFFMIALWIVKLKFKEISKALVFILLCVLYNTQNIMLTPISFVLMFYGLRLYSKEYCNA